MADVTLDVLAVGAHPDDVELGCGGTLLKLAALGYKTGILDMTRGEMGTRGTPELRAAEAQAAAEALKLTLRDNLEQPDTGVWVTEAARTAMIRAIRQYRPKIVLTHHWDDPHPDHANTARLVQEGAFLAGLHKYDREFGQARHRPGAVAYFVATRRVVPSFVVDISDFAADKLRAIQCHRSQFFDPASSEPESRVSQQHFLAEIEGRQRYYGSLIGGEHGEPFFVKEALNVHDPVELLTRRMNLYS